MSTPTQTVYVPHRGGTVLGIHQQAPWLAGSLAETTRHPGRGQPVFTDQAAAFGWLDRAGTRACAGRVGALDLSIAAVTAAPHPAGDGPRRIAVDRAALRDPATQVVRAGAAAPGPHPAVLAAWQLTTRVEAGVGWARHLAHGRPDRHGLRGLVDTVWALAYPIAYRDARTALTDQVILAASTAIADLDHRHDPHGVARHALQRLASLAIEATANPRPAVVPDPPPALRARAATAAGPEGTDWIAAADLTWTTALRSGAVDAIATTAADIYTTWRTPPPDISIGERDLTGWLRATLGARPGRSPGAANIAALRTLRRIQAEARPAGCGARVFLGSATDHAGLVGVELDPVTAAIAAALHRHAQILAESFADTRAPDGHSDLVIGNVPFGAVRLQTRGSPATPYFRWCDGSRTTSRSHRERPLLRNLCHSPDSIAVDRPLSGVGDVTSERVSCGECFD